MDSLLDPQSIAAMHAAPVTWPTIKMLKIVIAPGVETECRLYFTGAPAPPSPGPPLSEPPRHPSFPTGPRESMNASYVSAITKYNNDVCTYIRERHAYDKRVEVYNDYYARKEEDIISPAPNMIFTHGRGGGLDHKPTAAFTEGFARTQCCLSFVGTRELQQRIPIFRSLLNIHPSTVAFGGRSLGARASARAQFYTSVKELIFFTYPLVRGLDERYEELLNLEEDRNVLFISGDSDPLMVEQQLHGIRKRIRAKTWWIKLVDGDHRLEFWHDKREFPDRSYRVCNVAGQIAARWLTGERDPSRTELTIGWDKVKALPTISGWQEMEASKTTLSVNILKAGGQGSFIFNFGA